MPELTEDQLKFYYEWARKVAGGICAISHDDDAFRDNLIQEGVIRIWTDAPRFNDTPGSNLDGYLRQRGRWKIHTVVAREHQRPDRQNVSLLLEEHDTTLTKVDMPDLGYHHHEIVAALTRLTPRQREYVLLRFWVGLTERTLRHDLKFSSQLWYKPIHGARAKLRKALSHLEGLA
jgi:RNA polymerase sigma factor (sigma-70 family)